MLWANVQTSQQETGNNRSLKKREKCKMRRSIGARFEANNIDLDDVNLVHIFQQSNIIVGFMIEI